MTLSSTLGTVDPEGSFATLLAMEARVLDSFTWLINGSKAVFLFFLMYIVYKYGHIHLGRKNDKPEFTSLTYFAMIFAGGAAPTLFIYNVLEPLSHQQGNFFAQAGDQSQDEIDMFAINMNITGWSLATWLTFTIVAIASALAVHRFGLPPTLRSCFYPIFGPYTWGWIGGAIDGLAIVLAIISVTFMICINAAQIASGLVALGWVEENSGEDESTSIQKAVVWLTTLLSVASVFSGLHGGMKYVSLAAASLALVMGFLVFAMDDTKFILNLQVQAVGYYLQNSLFQINFWTDAFGQLNEGSGRAVDGRAAQLWRMSYVPEYENIGTIRSCHFLTLLRTFPLIGELRSWLTNYQCWT
jgi:choline-glycine betaine transporter